MGYGDGFSTYGYDQLFVEPASGSYADYNKTLVSQPLPSTNKYNNPATSYNYEQDSSNKVPEKKYNDVYDFLEKNVREPYEKKGGIDNTMKSDINEIKKQLLEFQHKNDTLLFFILFLVIYILVQFNSRSVSPLHYMPYNNTIQPSFPQMPIIVPS